MIINPKMINLKPQMLKLNGFFITATTNKHCILDTPIRTDLLLKALTGLRTFNGMNFTIYACEEVFQGRIEPSFFLLSPSTTLNLNLTENLLNLGELFNQTDILSVNENDQGELLKLGGFRGDFDTLRCVKNELIHKDDLDLKTTDKCSLIDLGGAWFQVVKYQK
jgi:hypothetical protein